MTTAAPQTAGGPVDRPATQSLADVVETILDKGLVIDAYVSAAVVGIEILTINARIVIASVDTYLRFAEAVNRLDLSESKGEGLPELVGDVKQGAVKGSAKNVASAALEKGSAKNVASAALEAAGDKLRNFAVGAADRRQPASRDQ